MSVLVDVGGVILGLACFLGGVAFITAAIVGE